MQQRQDIEDVLVSDGVEDQVAGFFLETNCRELRQALRSITELPPDQIPNHRALVAELRSTFPHSIVVLTDPEVAHLPLQRFTCFMHSFRLVSAKTAVHLMHELEVQPKNDFVDHLVAHHLSEISAEDTGNGDVVLYSRGQEIMHAGTVRAARVVSKWGLGWLWEHEVFEVPAQYGDKVHFYRRIEQGEAEQLFVSYIRKQEGTDLVDMVLASQE